jgi:predicted DNA-binding ribbon-helix-helix protein
MKRGNLLSGPTLKPAAPSPGNVRIGVRRTSIRLEPREWEVLESICRTEGISVNEFCTRAVRLRREHNQTSRIRVAMLDWCFARLQACPGIDAARAGLQGSSRVTSDC